MQKSTVEDSRETDVAFAIAVKLHEFGVPGLPRNYEIFYEAFAGANESLRKALTTLGRNPAQADLDQLANDYFAQNNRARIVETAHDAISDKVEHIMTLLKRERSALEKYGIILDRTSEGLSDIQSISRDMLHKIVGIMSAATDTTIEQGKQIAVSMGDTSNELAQVKEKLEEYKKLADTDPLTQIWNRRAFDKSMHQLYADRKSVLYSALILADIDRFKQINDKYGHPAGDRILQQVALIFKTVSKAETFVARTGGEEFAIIVDGLTEEATAELADDMRRIVEKTAFLGNDAKGTQGDRITISLGVCMATEASCPADLYAFADRALYASKLAGRNRVSKYPVPESNGLRKNWLLYRT